MCPGIYRHLGFCYIYLPPCHREGKLYTERQGVLAGEHLVKFAEIAASVTKT